MIAREVVINGISGFESKMATLFIQKASKYKSSIWIEKGERKANGKSLLGMMSLGLGNGTRIVIAADGEDQKDAVQELGKFMEEGLKEEE